MKTLRRIGAAMILSLTLAVYLFAGQIETPGAPAPAPTPATGSTTETTSTTTSIVLTILDLIYG